MSRTWLLERMEQWGERPALMWHDRPFSYDWLVAEAKVWMERQTASEGDPPRVVCMEEDYSPQAVACLLALIEHGSVIVPISRSAAPHRAEFSQIAEAETFISFDDADQCQIELREVNVNNATLRSLLQSGNPGLVLFTSGSTGRPKAALHDMGRFLSKFRSPREPLRAIAMPPWDHVAGLDTLFYTLSSGGVLICPADRNPSTICGAIESHKAELLPASPSFLNLVLISGAYQHSDMSSLRLVAYGSEVMPEATLARLREILPNCRFVQKYGLTELGSPRTRSKQDGSLWFRVDSEGFETKIVDHTLWIRAQSAMVGYLNAPNPFDDDGWVNTGDMVEHDGDYIRVVGRRSEIINVAGEKVFPAEVEGVVMKVQNIRDVMVRGEPNSVVGNIVVARVNLVKPEDPDEVKKRIRILCKRNLARYKIPARIEIADEEFYNTRFKKVRLPAQRASSPTEVW